MRQAIAHGGRLAEARALFPDAPQPFIDLSTGINPNAYPLPDLPPEVWTRLPEADDVAALEAVAAIAYGARPGQVVAAPGSTSGASQIAGACCGSASPATKPSGTG